MSTIYVHKVRENPEDGWGRNTGVRTTRLGTYDTEEKALTEKARRDAGIDGLGRHVGREAMCHGDIGESWVEEEEVQ